MKQITIKTALMRLVVVVLLTLGTISVSAQYYMNVVQKDGVKVQYLVSDIDSVYFSDQQSPTADYEYVDLGLSVLWATCNVGATEPEGYGDYYAWGETEPKTDYSWSTYKYCKGSSSTLTKYCNNSSYGNNGFTDTKTTLDPDDDVTHVKWGGDWRMPTKDEFTELLNNCTWTWATLNGVNGYRVTSNKSGYTDRSIFLPAAGYRKDASLYYVGSDGGYWSSSLGTVSPRDAWYVVFSSGNHYTHYGYRDLGLSVRPVCPSEEWLNAVSITLNSNLDSIVMGNTITLSATVKYGDEIIDREVTWTSDNPSIASVSKTGVVTAIAVGSTTITAICMGKTATCTITVIEPQNENRYEYVDLGLSVKWATCNVGATKPEEYGDYYAWGETEPKTDYSWSTYKYCNGSSSTMTKYCNSSRYGNNGFTDTKTTLDPDDDVAHVKWGGDWHMPTNDEFTELLNNCTWTWTTLNGVNGYRVTSNKSGYTDRSIFLPAAGYRLDTSLSDVGYYGYYWSSSLYTDYPYYAWSVFFPSGYRNTYYNSRHISYSVRPVCPSEEWLNAVSITLNSNLDSIVMGNTITLSATVKYGDEIIDREVTWTSDNPSIASVSKTGVVTAIAVGSTTITAICMGKTATCTITVIEPQYENGYAYVDLGLSVKWATCNVGATKPEEYGDYYAWGETEPKTDYSWSTYKYCNGSSSTLTKYCNKSSYGNNGYTDTKTTLDPDDDVAHVKWGGDWRMPTKDEFTELLNNCTWTWTTLNGVNGYRFTSNKTGYTDRSIFLPAAGYRFDMRLSGVRSGGYYWSSSLYTFRPYYAWSVHFNSSFRNTYDDYYRNYGLSVRPVCP